MTRRLRLSLILVLGSMNVGCGGTPKPVELVAYEHRARAQYRSTLEVRQPELLQRSRAAHREAIGAWRRKDTDAVIHYTRLADIYWRTAESLSHTKDLNDARVAWRRQSAQHAQSKALADERLAAVERDIRRLERLKTLRSELKRAKHKGRQKEAANGARRRIDTAMEQMREAESLDAERHAPGALNKARQSLQNAFDAFNAGRYADAGKAADLADADAGDAADEARPMHNAEAEQRAVDGELRKMLEEIASAPWADARIEKRGLVVSLRELFAPKKAQLGRTTRVEPVAALAQGYPQFSIIVEGHTDNRGPPKANLSLSADRGRAIAGVLGEMGVDVKRLSVQGKGDAEPVADNSTGRGRGLNRRVDVVFLRPTMATDNSGSTRIEGEPVGAGAAVPEVAEPDATAAQPAPVKGPLPTPADVVDAPAEPARRAPAPEGPQVKPAPTTP